VSGVIDLCYRDPESGDWVVADYKTDAVGADGPEELVRRYAAQGAVYTRAVQSGLNLAEPPRFELWLLETGRVLAVPAVHSAPS
jgi:ATP-dependent exoDNAse (exonuclease V) beta subunit